MFGSNHAYISDGKKTYYVPRDKKRFYNSKGQRDGFQVATKYCYDNLINPSSIIVFDSMLECDRFEYLKDLQDKGQIQNLEIHQKLLVQEEFKNHNGDLIPAITYNADFTYYEGAQFIVEDVKGASLLEDTRFELMKQVFDHIFCHSMYVRIIIKRNGQWLEWKLGDNKKSGVSNKKARIERTALKKAQHSQLVKDNKNVRQIARYKELKALSHLTSAQKKRLSELEEILKKEGYIL